ncbi:MAG: DUF2284 domain-containing protein [Treponema sp.]|jgi:predicted metal-binding protein|nr:DUF2284 domain-containing protein [Treponema sp.]
MDVLIEPVTALALNCGFSHAGLLQVDTIKLQEEVRAACEVNKCKAYASNWSCPPACGTLGECEARIRTYTTGLILQTTGALEDSLDYESMTRLGVEHEQHLRSFGEQIRVQYPASLLLGAGPCRRCEVCTYPDAPCRFPETMTTSMEAFGMVVSEVCTANHLLYYYGPNTLTYVGCVLLR